MSETETLTKTISTILEEVREDIAITFASIVIRQTKIAYATR